MSLDPTPPKQEPPISASSSNSDREKEIEDLQLFLGGSCNPTTWRQTVAIPYLEMNGISYYNPQVENWTPELVKIERHAKQSARLLLFVLDEQTRSTVSLVESAYMAGVGKRLVLVIYPLEFDVLSLTDTTKQTTSNIVETRKELTETSLRSSTQCQKKSSSSVLQSSSTVSSTVTHASGTISINGETISLAEFQELRQARFILQNLVDKRNTAMFSNIPQALDYVSKCLANDKEESRSVGIESDQMISMDPGTASKTLRDVYLMLDNHGDSDTEQTLMIMLRDKGLSYSCRPLKDVIKRRDGTALSLTNRQNEVGLLDATSTKSSLKQEIAAIESSRVMLFVITNKCRGLSTMVLASYFMALFRSNVVLCIQYLEEPCFINGERLTKNAIADYNRGRVYLCDYAMKSQVPVFEDVGEAVNCCGQRCGPK